eukprot:445817_1
MANSALSNSIMIMNRFIWQLFLFCSRSVATMRSRRNVIVVLILLAILYHWRKRIIKNRKYKSTSLQHVPRNNKKGPVIAFGCTGLAYAVFWGVPTFIHVVFTGVSGGSFAASQLFLDLDGAGMLQVGRGFTNMIQKNCFGGFMQNGRQTA